MPRPRPLSPTEARRSLAHRFSPTIDRLRQFSTRFGLRSRRVFLVWTRWSGEERGEGVENEYARVEILPTPRVADLTAIAFDPRSGGVLPVGSLRVDRISAQFTEDILEGRKIPVVSPGGGIHCAPTSPSTTTEHSGEDLAIDEPFAFFYEVIEDGRGDNPPEREKFRIAASPYRNEGYVEWGVILEQINENNDRFGGSQIG